MLLADGYLVTGLMDGSVLAWEARNAATPPRQVLQVDCHKGAVSALFFPSKVKVQDRSTDKHTEIDRWLF